MQQSERGQLCARRRRAEARAHRGRCCTRGARRACAAENLYRVRSPRLSRSPHPLRVLRATAERRQSPGRRHDLRTTACATSLRAKNGASHARCDSCVSRCGRPLLADRAVSAERSGAGGSRPAGPRGPRSGEGRQRSRPRQPRSWERGPRPWKRGPRPWKRGPRPGDGQPWPWERARRQRERGPRTAASPSPSVGERPMRRADERCRSGGCGPRDGRRAV
jgi:hypothetical protein